MGATNDDVLAAVQALHLHFNNEIHKLEQQVDREVNKLQQHIDREVNKLQLHIDREIARVREDFAELRGQISQMPTVSQMAVIEAKVSATPQTAEFYELRGRVEEISRRLPATLAYAPAAGQR